MVRTERRNWAPRIGFAYDLLGHAKTLLRGGYGIFYFLDRGGVGNQLSNNPDFNRAAVYQAVKGFRFALSGSTANRNNNSVAGTHPLPPAAQLPCPATPRGA